MNVTVFGVGYVGLVQAVVLADVGHNVCCVDVDEKKIESLKDGDIPIFEPGLSDLVQVNYEKKRIDFTTDAERGINHAELQFIAVGTPPDEDGSADLKYVLAVAGMIATHMQESKIVINKSTVPVGTADKVRVHMAAVLKKRNADLAFHVASNPEFLKEGSALDDCMQLSRSYGMGESRKTLYSSSKAGDLFDLRNDEGQRRIDLGEGEIGLHHVTVLNLAAEILREQDEVGQNDRKVTVGGCEK